MMNQQDYSQGYNGGNAPVQAQQSSYSNYVPQGMQQEAKAFPQQNAQPYSQAGGPYQQQGVYNNQLPQQGYQQSNDYNQYNSQPYSQAGGPYQQPQQQGGYNNNQNYNQPNNQQNYNQPNTYQQSGYNQPPQAGGYSQSSAPSLAGPAGLAALQNMEHVTVKQAVELAEAFIGFETQNKYAVHAPNGQILLRCGEKSSAVTRVLLGASRPMTIEIVDNNMKTVMSINRPFKVVGKNIEVGDGQGGMLGIIRKKFSVTCKRFLIENSSGQLLYTLEGNAIYPRKFKILDNNNNEVGQILKKWTGLAQEMFTDADTFTCFFPPGADTITRGLLVATTLFIDLTHFEK